jgi:hypothetical protein
MDIIVPVVILNWRWYMSNKVMEANIENMQYPDFQIMQIIRGDECIHECLNTWSVPQVGETVLLAKWDTVYKVTRVIHTLSMKVQTVQVHVEID